MAGASGDRNESLKETIFESLTAILSPDHVTRSNGEDQIKALEVTEGKRDMLCHVILRVGDAVLPCGMPFTNQNFTDRSDVLFS